MPTLANSASGATLAVSTAGIITFSNIDPNDTFSVLVTTKAGTAGSAQKAMIINFEFAS
jgi:hypothetical protein